MSMLSLGKAAAHETEMLHVLCYVACTFRNKKQVRDFLRYADMNYLHLSC